MQRIRGSTRMRYINLLLLTYLLTVSEVEKLIAALLAKSCQRDPIPTWLAKQLQHVLAPIIPTLCNVSFQSATLPASQKQAVVLPRLTTLDPNNLSSFRPISNLTFLSKLIER